MHMPIICEIGSTHVKDYARMQQLVYYLHLLNEIAHVAVPESLLLHVFLYGDVLAQPTA